MPIHVVVADLVDMDVDAIVNAANEQLRCLQRHGGQGSLGRVVFVVRDEDGEAVYKRALSALT